MDLDRGLTGPAMALDRPSPGKRGWSWALRLLTATALIVVIFQFIPLSEVLAVLSNARPSYLAAGVAVAMLGNYLQAVELWLLTRRQGLLFNSWKIFEVNMITRFYGQFLPSELMASGVKLYRLAAPKKQWGEVLAALGFARFVNMLTLVLLGVVFWLLDMPLGAGRLLGPLMIGLAIALVTAHVLLMRPAVGEAVRRLVPDWSARWWRTKLPARGQELANVTVLSYRRFHDMVPVISVFSLFGHALAILYFALFALAVDAELSIVTIGWVRVVLYLVLMLPISVSGIGLREGSLVLLLQDFGVSSGQAVALALILFANSLVANALGGLFEVKNVLRPEGGNKP